MTDAQKAGGMKVALTLIAETAKYWVDRGTDYSGQGIAKEVSGALQSIRKYAVRGLKTDLPEASGCPGEANRIALEAIYHDHQ